MDIKWMLAYIFMSMANEKHEKGVRQDGFRMFQGLRKCEARSNPQDYNNMAGGNP